MNNFIPINFVETFRQFIPVKIFKVKNSRKYITRSPFLFNYKKQTYAEDLGQIKKSNISSEKKISCFKIIATVRI